MVYSFIKSQKLIISDTFNIGNEIYANGINFINSHKNQRYNSIVFLTSSDDSTLNQNMLILHTKISFHKR